MIMIIQKFENVDVIYIITPLEIPKRIVHAHVLAEQKHDTPEGKISLNVWTWYNPSMKIRYAL